MRVMRLAPALLLVSLGGASLQTAGQQSGGATPPPPAQAPQTPAGAPAPPPQAPPVFRAGVDLIEIDVTVVDGRGRLVTDMLAPEFSVEIDGQPRKVVSAQFNSMRSSRGQRFDAAREPASDPLFSSNAGAARGRLILIAVDRDSITFGQGGHLMRAVGRFLDTMGPDDRVGLVTIPAGGPSVDFTSNHALVRKRAETIVGVGQRPRMTMNIGVVEALAINRQNDTRREEAVMQRFCGHLPAGSNAEQLCKLEVRSEAAAIMGQVRMQVENSLSSLRGLLDAMRDIEGPKSLVWISEGLPLEDLGSELAGFGRLSAEARTTVHVVLLDAPMVNMSDSELPATEREDRDLYVRGLELLSGYARGALLRVSANPDAVFQRLEDELSGQYLLGVESTQKDVDGKRHNISVSVRRKGVQVRARREFVMTAAGKGGGDPVETRLQRLLRSPFAVTDLPLRLATYAYRDPNNAKVRLYVATEIGGTAGTEPTNVALAFTLVDRNGKVAASGGQEMKISPVAGKNDIREHVGALSVDPGTYTLRLAAIDGSGRRGSIEHPVTAFEMSNVPFAVGDLIVADAPTSNEPLQPVVEPRVKTGRLAAYLELYADSAAPLDEARVRVEVSTAENAPPLAVGDGVAASLGTDPRSRTVSAVVPVTSLPPGRYMARAIVTRGTEKLGELTRPFVIDAAAAGAPVGTAAARSAPLAEMLGAPAAFKREELLHADVIGAFLDVIDQKNPAIKTVTAQVRKGSFAGAARQAFDEGDQVAAMFFRGLELLAAGDPNKAALQFDGAIRATPDFAPASFYLGVCMAATARDRQAVTLWRRAMNAPAKMPMQYSALSDALVRLGDVDQAVTLLTESLATWPDDEGLRRRLALAQARALKHPEALATLEPYLAKHPDDQEILLVALHAVYAAQLEGKAASQSDRDRMKTWAAAYKGPHAGMVAAWAAYVTK